MRTTYFFGGLNYFTKWWVLDEKTLKPFSYVLEDTKVSEFTEKLLIKKDPDDVFDISTWGLSVRCLKNEGK